MNVFVFDIETIPDVDACRRLYDLHDLPEAEVVEAVKALRRGEGKSDFFPHYLQQVVAISCVLRHQDKFTLWSLGDEDTPEKGLIERFYKGLERYVPTLVSWNGGGFDLPVLHYRALKNGVVASQYWELGEKDREFKFNHYLGRYHLRHIDLMDILASYQSRANAPLDHIASLLGFPGKMGIGGAQVWDAYQAGRIREIRQYCEVDVLNTYLIFLAFEHMRGNLSENRFKEEQDLVRQKIKEANQPYLNDFLDAWGGRTNAA
jgi:predicted PolB exonuclease-like 3'-5' exonuclease